MCMFWFKLKYSWPHFLSILVAVIFQLPRSPYFVFLTLYCMRKEVRKTEPGTRIGEVEEEKFQSFFFLLLYEVLQAAVMNQLDG